MAVRVQTRDRDGFSARVEAGLSGAASSSCGYLRSGPASEAAKARKDLRQAEQLLEVLAEDRPGDVSAAWQVLMERKTMIRSVRSAVRKMSESLQERLDRLI